MEKKALSILAHPSKSYFLLTKPGIIFGNSVTAAAGFFLARGHYFDGGLFFAMLLGLGLIVASGCVFNNYIDRIADEKMARTKDRPLVSGAIAPKRALQFGTVLLLLGALVLAFFTNLLALSIALLGFFVYVALYSLLKYRTVHATLVGSIAGAVPPVVGYTAVSYVLDPAALLLFLVIALWQMPHFYAIAIYRQQDYAAASIPVLPIKKGILSTKIHMLLYIAAFIGACLLLYMYGYVGTVFLIVASVLGSLWGLLSVTGFWSKNNPLWARRMFIFSLVVVMGISVAVTF